MRIVVCIKPVKSEIVCPNETKTDRFLMNPYDLCALEACVELKKKIDCTIFCICMGAMDAQNVLTKALAIGADQAILLNDSIFGGSDTVATSYIISNAIKKLGQVDLIVCGQKSIDGETGQVVFGLSERLNYTAISEIEQIEGSTEERIILTKREGGVCSKMDIGLPLVIAYNKFRVTQPNISLLALKRANKKPIKIWHAVDLQVDVARCGIKGSKTKVLDIKSELEKKEKTVLTGTIEEQIKVVLSIMKQKSNDELGGK